MKVLEYLESKGLQADEVGENYQLCCPLCGDDRPRLGISKTSGAWQCFACGEKGKTLFSFQKLLSDDKIRELKFDAKATKKKAVELNQALAGKFNKLLDKKGRGALEYLTTQRGFSRETIDHFQLGSWLKKGHEYVALPFWKRGKLVNFKYRAIAYKEKKWKWRRHKGGESSLFHHDVVDQKQHESVFITEAELDTVALYNAGIKNVLAVTTGAKAFKQEWYDELERFKKIYLVYDNDVDGQAGAEKAASRLGFDRCFNVVLPKDYKDINEYFWDFKEKKPTGNTKKEFEKLAKDARRFEVKDTLTLKDALRELHKDRFLADEEEIVGYDTPWWNVNKVLGGAKPGHLVVVSAPPKIGKTTWVLNWMRHLATKSSVKSALYCCEMRPKRVAEKIVAMMRPDFLNVEEMTELQIAQTAYQVPSDMIYLAYPKEDQLTLDNVCEWAKNTVQRYGVKFICFDNLHFLVRGQDAKEQIGEVTRRFKLLAEQLGIVFCLIVHPRKVGDKRMTADDLKDSSSIYQDLDTLFMIHRQRKNVDDADLDSDAPTGKDGNIEAKTVFGNFDPLCEVHVSGRWCEGGVTNLYFEGRRALFHASGSMFHKSLLERKKRFEEHRKRKSERKKK